MSDRQLVVHATTYDLINNEETVATVVTAFSINLSKFSIDTKIELKFFFLDRLIL